MHQNPILSAVYEGRPVQEVSHWSRQFRLSVLSYTIKELDSRISELSAYRQEVAKELEKRIELKELNFLKIINSEVGNDDYS